jgi:hypothetical protein
MWGYQKNEYVVTDVTRITQKRNTKIKRPEGGRTLIVGDSETPRDYE